MCIGTWFTVEKISPRAGLELATTKSVGQHLTHCAPETPASVGANSFLSELTFAEKGSKSRVTSSESLMLSP